MNLLSPVSFNNRHLARTRALALAVGMTFLVGVLVHAQQPVLPPLDPNLLDSALPAQPRVVVKEFHFEGNTVIPDDSLRQVVSGFIGRELTIEGIEEARRRITLLYVERGFINSGAILPDQDIANGVITFRIVEGKLTKVHLSHVRPVTPTAATQPASTQPATEPSPAPDAGPATQPAFAPPRAGFMDRLGERLARPLRNSYLLPRIWRNPDAPLNVVELKDNLELIRQNPNVKRINAELRPGVSPGQAELDVQVEPANPWQLTLNFNNRRSPSIGAERFELFVTNTNLLGLSDTLSLRYGITQGGIDEMELAGLDDFSIDYAIPITSYDTTLFAGFARSDELVVEETFAPIDITSDSKLYNLGLRQPFHRTPNSEFALSLALSVRHNKTAILGEDFPFPPFRGDDGDSNSSAIRFAQEYTTRNTQRAIALRSTFSFGIDAFDATISDDNDLADSEFFSWLGQLQYVRRLGESNNQFIFRLSTQLTPDPLLSVEQFPIGGFDTVRGYRENQLVRDNAIVASAELRIPIIRQADRSILELAPFFDAGYGWNEIDVPDEELISSAGLGLLWNPNDHISGSLYWGFPFRKFDEGDDEDLQDWGFHFSLSIFAF